MKTEGIILITLFLCGLALSGGLCFELWRLDKKYRILLDKCLDLRVQRNWFKSELEKRIEFIREVGLMGVWRGLNPILELAPVEPPTTPTAEMLGRINSSPPAPVIHLPDQSGTTHTVVAPELRRVVDDMSEDEALAFLAALRQRHAGGTAAPIAA